jgi:aspartate aminotransferase
VIITGFYELAEKALALEREGRKVVRLNVGDTNLPTPQAAIEAAVRRLRDGKSGYVSSAGMAGLREKAAEREGCGPENVVIGPGSKLLIYGLMSVLCKAGDRVAFPSPHWPAYSLASAQLSLEAHVIQSKMEDSWAFEPARAAGAKMLIICNPLNPTGTVYGEETIRAAIEEAADSGAHVILDEAYKGLSFREIPRYEGAIRVRSFSKEFSMEGWRLGYAVAPEEVAKKLVSFNQITSTCVPPFVQEAGLACLEREKVLLEANRRVWRSRMDAARKALVGAGFSFAEPDAGIYFFATHPKLDDSEAFAMELLGKEGIAVAPGTGFGDYRRFIRICVNQPEETLREAIARMGRLLEGL